MRDNGGMPLVRSGFVTEIQLAEQVESSKRKLSGEVAWIRHAIGEDTAGDPAIYFRIVLKDSASQEETLAEVTNRVRTTLFKEIRPYEDLGLIPYFSFRSESEQASRSEPEWVA